MQKIMHLLSHLIILVNHFVMLNVASRKLTDYLTINRSSVFTLYYLVFYSTQSYFKNILLQLLILLQQACQLLIGINEREQILKTDLIFRNPVYSSMLRQWEIEHILNILLCVF